MEATPVDRRAEGIALRFLSGSPYAPALAWTHGGYMAQMGHWNNPARLQLERTVWAIDNGCYSKGDSFVLAEYFRYLERMQPYAATCLFAVAPDVPFNHAATWERSYPVFDEIRRRGFPVAFAVQNGVDPRTLDYAAFDAVFIAGTSAFKTSQAARRVVFGALERGLHVHIARRNGPGGIQEAYDMGAHTVDGTFLAFGPDKNWPILQDYVRRLCGHTHLELWGSDSRFGICRACGRQIWRAASARVVGA